MNNRYCERDFVEDYCTDEIQVETRVFSSGQTQGTTGGNKVLVRVGNVTITQPIRDEIHIDEGFYDIKKIQRRVILDQVFVSDGYIFGEGYMLKNISYATPIEGTGSDCVSDCLAMKNTYNDLTAKVKFDFANPITITGAQVESSPNMVETAYLNNCIDVCDKGSVSQADCQRYYTQTVTINEPYKYELDSYTINETVFMKNECNEENSLYDTVTEKLVLVLNISVYQYQVVTT
jgi:hypothetical protein